MPERALGALRSGGLTAASTAVVMGVAALIGVIVAREFGRTDETDGFFAAYGVFVVLAIASLAIRVAVLPSLARSRDAGRLGGELAGYAIAAASLALPVLLALELAADRKSTRLNSSHLKLSRMPSSA